MGSRSDLLFTVLPSGSLVWGSQSLHHWHNIRSRSYSASARATDKHNQTLTTLNPELYAHLFEAISLRSYGFVILQARWQCAVPAPTLYNYILLSQLSFPHSDMADQPQSSRFRVLLESALQDYQRQTGTTLASHPLAEKLQNCDSVESVTAVLQEQTRAFTEFRGGDNRIMKSLKSVVSALYTLSASTALGEAIGLVRRKASIDVEHL